MSRMLTELYGLEEGSGQWVLVIRPDPVCYGPFASEQEALAAASQHWADSAELQHAESNADFYAAQLIGGKK
jgi:hypothetical protein